MKTITLDMSGMTCDHCGGLVQSALEALAGVTRCDVTLNRATVTFDTARCAAGDIVSAVGRAGSFQVSGFQAVESA